MSRKRTIDAFFGAPQAKKPRNSSEEEGEVHVSLPSLTTTYLLRHHTLPILY